MIHLGAGVWLLHARVEPAPPPAEDPSVLVEIASLPDLDLGEPDLASTNVGVAASKRSIEHGAPGMRIGAALESVTALGTGDGFPEGSGVVVLDGSGMSRPLESIHGGFGAGVDPAPAADGAPDMKAETLSERATRTLKDELYARDTSLGLGADGPVLQALATSAQASTAPVDGRAVFDVVVGGDGMVASLTVAEGGIAWSGVAKDALDAVRGKKARVPMGAKGVAIKVELSSRVLLPSGHSANTQVSVGGIPVNGKKDDKAIKVSLLNPIPKIVLVPMDADGKVMVPMAYVELFGTNVDPTDVGAQPRRVIASKVLSEHLL